MGKRKSPSLPPPVKPTPAPDDYDEELAKVRLGCKRPAGDRPTVPPALLAVETWNEEDVAFMQ